MSRLVHRRRRWGFLAAAASAFVALSSPMSAQAIAPADIPDIGADTGRFTLPITCRIDIPWLGNLTVINLPASVDIQGIAPVQLGPGQKFNLSQASGALTLPSWLSQLAGVVAINRADADVTSLQIGATGSTPSSINVASLTPLKASNVTISGNKPIVVGLPKTGTFTVGPYTAPQSGIVALKFISAVASVKLKSALGFSLTVKATCKAAAAAGGGASLLSIAVGGPAGQPEVNFQNQPLNFPKAPNNQLVGIVHAPYQCAFQGNNINVGVAVTATIPLTVSKTGSLPFKEASGAIIITPEEVNKFIDAGHTSLSGNVTKLTLRATGGTPTDANVIPAPGLSIPSTPLVRDQKLIITLPTTGTLDAGPFTPDAGSKSIIVGLGDAAADLRFEDGTGGTATCNHPTPEALLVDAAVV